MDVLMPQLGETVAEGKISKWFVKAGDSIQPGQNLFEIETDKVSMEVPAIAAGTLAAIHVAAGEVAPVGAVVAVIQGKGEAVSTEKPAPVAQQAATIQQAPFVPAKAGTQGQEMKELDSRLRGNEQSIGAAPAPKPGAPFKMEPFREIRSPARNYGPARLPGGAVVTPLARRLAGEAGIDLSNVKGSGPHGRIVAADIEVARKAPAPASASANVVVTANVAIGHALALVNEVKGNLILADVIVKAWATALQRVTAADNTDIALSTGSAHATIRGASSKSLTAIAAARRDAANGTSATTAILMTEAAGIATVTGVLRPPYTTMLSLGSQRRVPVEAEDGAVRFVTVVTATLICDEAAIDAALGADLLAAFKGFVEKPVTMIV
jgi:pyruvate/2-oxoglutarate dehydrogenase complex dihydrolipoamide acyltransferase (E2) component